MYCFNYWIVVGWFVCVLWLSLLPHAVGEGNNKTRDRCGMERQRKEKDATTKWIGGSSQPGGYERRPNCVASGCCVDTAAFPLTLEADLVRQEALSMCPHLQNSQALSAL